MLPIKDMLLWISVASSLGGLPLTDATAVSYRHTRSLNQTVQWKPCEGINSTLPIECGFLTVPLDYTSNTSSATTDIALLRIPALEGPSKGSILINFGGPGGEGRYSLAGGGPLFAPMSGGRYDLVAFDPRNETERELHMLKFPIVVGNSSDTAPGYLWGTTKLMAKSCYENGNDTGSFLGTAFVVRDMMEIANALDGDGLLRFWGFSYGTTLGATAAAMFPDRIDKMVLDGVLNPHEYYHSFSDIEMLTDTDKTWSGFFTGCLAQPDNCVLAHRNASAAELEEAVYHLLYKLKYEPIVYEDYLIDYNTLKSIITAQIYTPTTWPDLAAGLDALLSGTPTPDTIDNLVAGLDAEAGILEPNFGIKCGDKSKRAQSIREVQPSLDALAAKSRLLGDIMPMVTMQCAQWPFDARERYEGDFRAKTREPVLLIGNTFDPLTPLVSARNVSAGLEGSVVLEHGGYGHASLGQLSSCTIQAVAAYFTNGTLPKPGTVCEPNLPLFATVPSSTSLGKRSKIII